MDYRTLGSESRSRPHLICHIPPSVLTTSGPDLLSGQSLLTHASLLLRGRLALGCIMDSTSTSTTGGGSFEDMPPLVKLQISGDLDTRRLEPSPTFSTRSRPETPRRSTDPHSSMLLQTTVVAKPRPQSPVGRGHLRSQSAYTAAPPMTRTRSLPSVSLNAQRGSPSHSPVRPSSPLRPPPTLRSSPRKSFEEMRPLSSGPSFTEIESIAEDSELDLTPRNLPLRESQNSPGPLAANSTAFSRSNSGRRRPTSPLYQTSQPNDSSSVSSSPSLHASRFNESFPSHGSFSYSATSSMPSTPTSFRSRSPSISSLDAIPDSPDAEEAAEEAAQLAKLKAAADAAEAVEAEAETARKMKAAGLQVPGNESGGVVWSTQSLKEKRKRWSVCGAERRGDFEMETIWED